MNPVDPTSHPLSPAARRAPRIWFWVFAVLIALALVFGAVSWLRPAAGTTADPPPASAGAAAAPQAARAKGGADAARPIPVAVQPAVKQAFEHTLTALATVTPRANVTVKVQVDGQLQQVLFREGQLVHVGDQLAQIDPRPYQAALANARAQLERDDAQLQGALLDRERYRALSAEDSIPRQQLDTQEALVRQLQGTVNADKAQIQTAELNLNYTRVVAPVSGRVGLRLVDVGNIVHAADATGLVVVTQVQPIDVIFPIPQDALPGVLRHMRDGTPMVVDAFDRDGRTMLATGRLASIDNLIDTTTGTVKLKAEFANRDLTLFPNQFVNARLHLETLPGTLTIPTAAVQRGAPGLFVYVAQADGTVAVRTPSLGLTEGDRVQVIDGLAVNDQVVVDGTDKLRDGAKIEVIDPEAQKKAAAAAAAGARQHRRGAQSADGTPGKAPPADGSPARGSANGSGTGTRDAGGGKSGGN